jgi:choline-sulfatase
MRLYVNPLVCLLLCIGGFAQKNTHRPARPNVILITVDTLRADHVSAYGFSKVKTPAIDSLAANGILYENAVAPVPLTLASHAAMLTGTYPFYNGVQDFTGEPLNPHFRTVAEAFKANGYATAAFVSSFVLDRSWGLARGFDTYYDAFSPESFTTKNIALVERTAAGTIAKATQWLRSRQPGRSFFLWIHLYDPHSPYAAPEPYRSRYKNNPYAGEVAYTDHQLGLFFADLKKMGQFSRSTILFLSDHGESLGEHGENEHGFFLYRSTTHIPLILKPAGRPQPAKRIRAAVDGVSVAATLISAARLKDPLVKQLQPEALPLAEPETADESTAYTETYYPFSSFGWSPLRSLQTSRYQYIEAPQAELYNHEIDPTQHKNLWAAQPALGGAFKSRLEQLTRRFPPPLPAAGGTGISLDAAEKLRALGYVAYKSPVSAEAIAKGLPDPKTKIREFNAILKAGDAMHAGRFAESKQLLEEVRAADPEMYLVPFMLGELALRQNDWSTAAVEFDRCLVLNPRFDQAMTGSAQALARLGSIDAARERLDAALKLNPQNYRALYQLGFILFRADPSAAGAALEKVISIQPNFALAHRDLGMLRYEQKAYSAALAKLENAIRLGIEDKQILNTAGIAASQLGRQTRAIELYKQALQLDPNYAEAHLNLALAYQQTGRAQLAMREYQTACRLNAAFCQYVPR